MSSRITVEPKVMVQEEKKTGLDALPVQEGVIGGADGPTSILITRNPSYGWIFVSAAIAAIIACVGIYKTKRY